LATSVVESFSQVIHNYCLIILNFVKNNKYEQVEPTTRKGQWLNYGPYKDIVAKSKTSFNAHFENNAPFIKVFTFIYVCKTKIKFLN
jgi:hypothetical protein